MKSTRLVKLFVVIIFLGVFFACQTTQSLRALTPQELSVVFVEGNQTKTLELAKSHTPIATVSVSSEYQARIKAASLDADVAQLIAGSSYNGITSIRTYRFWKRK